MPKYLITARATILESYALNAASEEDAIERRHHDEGEYLGALTPTWNRRRSRT